MKTEQSIYTDSPGWETKHSFTGDCKADLVFLFGSRELLKKDDLFSDVRQKYPHAQIVGCSTAGEILNEEVLDNSIVCSAISFSSSSVKVYCESIGSMDESYQIGQSLSSKIDKTGLKHVMLLSEGLNINGSELIKGIYTGLEGAPVTVTGGLAADQSGFEETVVVCNAAGKSNLVLAIGFYGDKLLVGTGSKGGWDSFGVDRLVTKSKANILYELDGQPALELYKKFLGAHAAALPASALLFPLSVKLGDTDISLVRTVLSVNEKDGSMIFAGDIPEGDYVRLMKAGFEKLIDGAAQAAELSEISLNSDAPDFAVLISCVGRKLVLKQRVEEEVEIAREIFGQNCLLSGFYSYGEIGPGTPESQRCELHNQTMTITLFKEL